MPDQIKLDGDMAVLRIREVYIHSSKGRPAIDAGTGWAQEAVTVSETLILRAGFLSKAGSVQTAMPISFQVALYEQTASFPSFSRAGPYWDCGIRRGVSA